MLNSERRGGGSAIPADLELSSLTCGIAEGQQGRKVPSSSNVMKYRWKRIPVLFLSAPRPAGWVLIPVKPYKKTAQIFDVVKSGLIKRVRHPRWISNRSETESLYHRQLQFLNEAAFIMPLKYSSKQSM